MRRRLAGSPGRARRRPALAPRRRHRRVLGQPDGAGHLPLRPAGTLGHCGVRRPECHRTAGYLPRLDAARRGRARRSPAQGRELAGVRAPTGRDPAHGGPRPQRLGLGARPAGGRHHVLPPQAQPSPHDRDAPRSAPSCGACRPVPTSAAAAQQLRYFFFRSPRAIQTLIIPPVMGVVVAHASFADYGLAAQSAAFAAMSVVAGSFNLFGYDGPGFSYLMLGGAPLNRVLIGKAVAPLLYLVPLVVVFNLTEALIRGTQGLVVPAILAGTSVVALGVGVGSLSSIFNPSDQSRVGQRHGSFLKVFAWFMGFFAFTGVRRADLGARRLVHGTVHHRGDHDRDRARHQRAAPALGRTPAGARSLLRCWPSSTSGWPERSIPAMVLTVPSVPTRMPAWSGRVAIHGSAAVALHERSRRVDVGPGELRPDHRCREQAVRGRPGGRVDDVLSAGGRAGRGDSARAQLEGRAGCASGPGGPRRRPPSSACPCGCRRRRCRRPRRRGRRGVPACAGRPAGL